MFTMPMKRILMSMRAIHYVSSGTLYTSMYGRRWRAASIVAVPEATTPTAGAGP